MKYTELNTAEKTAITSVLNARRKLEEAEKEYRRLLDRAKPLVKTYQRIDGRQGETLVYKPATSYSTLDTTKLKREHPEIVAKYQRQVNRKDSIQCLL